MDNYGAELSKEQLDLVGKVGILQTQFIYGSGSEEKEK